MWATNEQVVVRAHQAIGMHLDLASVDGARETRQEESVVLTPLEQSSPCYGTVEDMVPLASFVLTRDSRHESREAPHNSDSREGGRLQV
ncbi:MAG: hypothetical protein ACI835_005757 [Planctomycetota bacterium]